MLSHSQWRQLHYFPKPQTKKEIKTIKSGAVESMKSCFLSWQRLLTTVLMRKWGKIIPNEYTSEYNYCCNEWTKLLQLPEAIFKSLGAVLVSVQWGILLSFSGKLLAKTELLVWHIA